MVARRALVRIEGDMRQNPPEDSLVGASRVNGLDGDVQLVGVAGVAVDLTADGDDRPVITVSAPGKLDKTGGTLTGPLALSEVSVPFPSGTLDLGAIQADRVRLTVVGGARNISSFGVAPAGVTRTLLFDAPGPKTIAVSANIIVPGIAAGNNVAPGYRASAEFISEGGGVWRALWFTKADGTPLAATVWTGGNLTSAINEAGPVVVNVDGSSTFIDITDNLSNTYVLQNYVAGVILTGFGKSLFGSITMRRWLRLGKDDGAQPIRLQQVSSGNTGGTIICPGGVDLVLNPGDMIEVESVNTDGFRVINVHRDSLVGSYRGTFTSEGALATITNPAAGDYADVDAGVGQDVQRYIRDVNDNKWVLQGATAQLTAAQVKQFYESNLDTNAYTNADKAMVTNFTASLAAKLDRQVSSAVPNATVPVVYHQATNAATDVDLALVPKGVGGFSLAVPDNAVTGGNKRGASAVDLQLIRQDAAQVASGEGSALVGGRVNTASGLSSAVLGGNGNTASANYAVALGGSANTVSASFSAALAGFQNVVSASYSAVLGGRRSTAQAEGSAVIGSFGDTRALKGAKVFASAAFVNPGDCQVSKVVLGASTSTTTATRMTSDLAAAGAQNQIILPDNSAVAFEATVVARSSANLTRRWTVTGLIRRGSGAASTTLPAAATVTITHQDSSLTATLAVTADTTLGGLAFTVTGAAGVSTRWAANIETTEIVG